ncbi:hypothetical protein PS017_25095, partial [Shigella sonnei]|nr:hypothetical protein [Shigella sonnei]
DIQQLLDVLHKLRDQGNTIVVIAQFLQHVEELLNIGEVQTGGRLVDIQQLLDVLHKLRDQGNTIVVIAQF